MKNKLYICLLFMHLYTITFAQSNTILKIQKANRHHSKSIKLPIKVRVKKTNSEIVKFQLERINDGYWYGNQGKVRIANKDIEAVNITGMKETIKYTAFILSTTVSVGGFFIMTHASGNSAYQTPTGTSLLGAAYLVVFTPISILIYNYPRTRYKTAKFSFYTY